MNITTFATVLVLTWSSRSDAIVHDGLAADELACDLGRGARCYEAGTTRWYQANSRAEVRRATALLERGCFLGHMPSCNMALAVSVNRRDQIPPGVLGRVGDACEKGQAQSCVALSRAFAVGHGRAWGPVKARQLLWRACGLDGRWCDSLYLTRLGRWSVPIALLLTFMTAFLTRGRPALRLALLGSFVGWCALEFWVYLGRSSIAAVISGAPTAIVLLALAKVALGAASRRAEAKRSSANWGTNE